MLNKKNEEKAKTKKAYFKIIVCMTKPGVQTMKNKKING